MRYEYIVNKNERGEFYADVRDENGETVHEVRTDEECGGIFEIEAGYMKHPQDVAGLADYLRDIGVMRPGDCLSS